MQSVTFASRDEKIHMSAKKLGKWMDDVIGGGFHKYAPEDTWKPAVNLYEGPTGYCLVVDLAGVKTEHIDLRVEEDVLIISGQRLSPMPPEDCGQVQMHMMEIDHGWFCRTMELPKGVDVDAIQASYRSGYLWIHMEKKAK